MKYKVQNESRKIVEIHDLNRVESKGDKRRDRDWATGGAGENVGERAK